MFTELAGGDKQIILDSDSASYPPRPHPLQLAVPADRKQHAHSLPKQRGGMQQKHFLLWSA